MKTINFGIIGCGVISEWHASVIEQIEGAKLLGAFDQTTERLEAFCEKHQCQAFPTLQAMLACAKIDAVCICTPSGAHAPIIIEAANAGKHIVVEKPIAITKEQLYNIVEAVERNGVQLTSIAQCRYGDAVQFVKKFIDDGKLGKLLVGDVYMKLYRSPEYYASAGWRGTWAMDGGGALMNQGIHGIDCLQYLMGQVKSVSAVCKTLDRDIEVEDAAVAAIEYENGAIGVIQGTTCVNPGYPVRMELHGTKGSIVLENYEIVRFDVEGEKVLEEREVASDIQSYKDPTAFGTEGHKRQFTDFVNALRNGTKPMIDVYEGKKPVDVILSIYESSKKGEKVFLVQEDKQ